MPWSENLNARSRKVARRAAGIAGTVTKRNIRACTLIRIVGSQHSRHGAATAAACEADSRRGSRAGRSGRWPRPRAELPPRHHCSSACAARDGEVDRPLILVWAHRPVLMNRGLSQPEARGLCAAPIILAALAAFVPCSPASGKTDRTGQHKVMCPSTGSRQGPRGGLGGCMSLHHYSAFAQWKQAVTSCSSARCSMQATLTRCAGECITVMAAKA
jgi:hypothetical protein